MNSSTSETPAPGGAPSQLWLALQSQLDGGEGVLAWLATDLDEQRCYGTQLIALTRSRILAAGAKSTNESGNAGGFAPKTPLRPQPPDAGAGSDTVRSWPLSSVRSLEAGDRGGLGVMELCGTDGVRTEFPYTVACAATVNRFVEAFESVQSGRGDTVDDTLPHEEELSAGADLARTGVLFRLWPFARQHAALLLLGFLLSSAATAAALVPPYLTMPLMDTILIPYQTALDGMTDAADLGQIQQDAAARFRQVPWYLLALAGAAVAAWLLGWAQGAVLAYVSERISAGLRNRTYAHLHSLSLEYFGGRRTGDLISRISSDSDRLCTFLSDSVVDFAADVLLIIGTAVVLVSIHPMLAVVTLVPFPPIAWLMYMTRDRLQHGFHMGGRAWSHMTSVLSDAISGIRIVKAFSQERREIARFDEANRQVVAANDRVNTVWTFFWPLIGFLNQMGLLVVWAFGCWLVFRNEVTVGVLTAFLAYIGRFYLRLESMSRMVNVSQRAATSAQRLFDILDRRPSVPEPEQPVHPGRLSGRIEFRDVSFRYGNRLVIDRLNFAIGPGEVIGLAGHTGAGKTTLVNLVCRFFDVAEGEILIDGVDLRRFPVDEFRNNIGIVPQDSMLFYGTIADNIAYGRPEATREEIVAAAKAARCHEFILRLSDGYDSIVGERGQLLSGGERQRVAIARALLFDPRILILDEATSAVDVQTEREIQEALQNLIRGRTTIAIAHRLSTLRRADRIFVMENGRIVEIGSHGELLANSGVYARLHQAQLLSAQSVAV